MKIRNTILMCLLPMFTMACSSDSTVDKTEVTPEEVSGDVTIHVTTNTRSYDFAEQSVDFNANPSMSPTIINLNPSERFQEMDGFGAAITGSTCYNLLQMADEDRISFLKETFSPTEGAGYSYVRVAIGCSDFSLSEYTCCDEEGIENFSLQGEEENYVIPILSEILEINPSLKIIGSPWTAPRWMKVNNLDDMEPYNSWTGGQLNPNYYQDYATYFVKWIQAMEDNDIHINAITLQNEPLNRGNSASMYMGWEEQQKFIKNALSEKIDEAGLNDVKIYLFDHNYNYDNIADQQNYVTNIYDDEDVRSSVAGAAYHNYGGSREELNTVHDAYPDKELIFTETSIGTWNGGRDLETRLMEDMEEVALGTVNNWCKAVIVWNLMLDTDLGPNRDGGCQTCYGAVDIDKNDYKTISRNSHYYIIAHLSSVVKPGATRIGTTGYTDTGLTYSAFENTNGTYALVLLNNSDDSRKITINDGNNNFTYDVPAKAVVSYSWEK